MNQPTDLAAVRAAADTVLGRFGCNRADCRDCAKYVFATIPADATAPIDAEWLREVWGYVQPWKGQERRFCLPDYTMDIVHAYDGQWYVTWIDSKHWDKSITTRHQFMQLMTALGIQPQPPKAKE